MATLKTVPTAASVTDFLARVPDDETRADCDTLVEIMSAATKSPPVMWGPSIVGFGQCHLVYASGRELDWMLIGFSPRKGALSLYLMCGLEAKADLLAQLGKHKMGKGCLYVKRLSDVHLPTLKKLIRASVQDSKKSQGRAPKKT